MNKADMIFDLSSIWATVKEIFPYFDRLPFDWDEQYHTCLERLLQMNNERDFHELLTSFMESLRDGHTKYIPPAEYRISKPFVAPDKPSFSLDDGILTIKLNEFLHDHTSYVKNLLEKTKNVALVRLDIRDNIGGNTYYAANVASLFISGVFESCQKWTQIRNAVDTAGASQIVRYSEARIQQYIKDGLLTEESVADAKKIMNHTNYEWYTSSHGIENRKAIYDGPLQILISKKTLSAAEDFAAMFKSAHRAPLVGEATYGSTGTPCTIPLRCGGHAQVVSVGYRLLDGTEFISTGIQPDIETAVID